MAYYSNYPLNSDEVSRETGSNCYGYGTGQSHESIIQRAGGEIGYDGFQDPRPNTNGPIYADRVFINDRTKEIQGINFNDKDGKFCCSYLGSSYEDIKDSNKRDLENKQERSRVANKQTEYDEYGVVRSPSDSQNYIQTQQNEMKR